jgi:hypothetical protein
MHELIRKANRAGILTLPSELLHDIPSAVAAAIDCPDLRWVREHWPVVFEHGAIEIHGESLVLSNYHVAQYSTIEPNTSSTMSARKLKETKAAVEAGLIEEPNERWRRTDAVGYTNVG